MEGYPRGQKPSGGKLRPFAVCCEGACSSLSASHFFRPESLAFAWSLAVCGESRKELRGDRSGSVGAPADEIACEMRRRLRAYFERSIGATLTTAALNTSLPPLKLLKETLQCDRES